MAAVTGRHIGTVVGNTSPQEFKFILRSFGAKLGDLVCVQMEVPSTGNEKSRPTVLVWGRIVELARFNPFLPAEAGQELAEEGVSLVDTVLSHSRDQIEGRVLVLGVTIGDLRNIHPLNYPVQPGASVVLPPAESVKTVLTGDEVTPRLRLGTLIGRSDVGVGLKTNAVVARHMAILAMTGGGKTVAARRVIRELLECRYPVVILDPHGDYLGLWAKRHLFPKNHVRLFFPHLTVREETRGLIGYLVAEMTQGFTDAQKDKYHEALEKVDLSSTVSVRTFIDRLLQQLETLPKPLHGGTIPAIRRALRMVQRHLESMEVSNERLRKRAKLMELEFEAMPDSATEPEKFARPGQASILYLGGYDHLTQSTIVALVLQNLFDHRASMSNRIPPIFAVIEEAHNFIPSHAEGQADTPSVDAIRKVITEGRKFGMGLLLISQRPSRLDETTLSQCNTFLVFRLVNPRDQSFVEKVMENLTKADSRLLPGFGPGQGIVSGQAVRFPLLIQVDWDKDLVTPAIGDEDFLAAVADWESSPQAETVTRSDGMMTKLDKALGVTRG